MSMRTPNSQALGSSSRLVRATIVLLAAAVAPACHSDGRNSPTKTTEITPAVRALMDKTLKNLRFVQGGTFEMGDFGSKDSPEKMYYSPEQDNKPLHKVTLDGFSMSAYKTTYADFDVYSEATGTPKVGMDDLTRHVYRHLRDTAAGVNWYQARAYCHWLGDLLKLPMDLPTEAQWEYAARDRGKFFLFATDNGKAEPGRNVWSYDQRQAYQEKKLGPHTTPSLALGKFPPNPLGLYDMMTDGLEWTLDWYGPTYYATSPEMNPKGPPTGKEKVLRSSRSGDGENLSFGDGMTIARHHREPDPPKINWTTGKPVPDPSVNMTTDTAARCVVNLNTPVPAAKP
jgi:formylglycine-generating enzyme required for sulfatase activity